ncbi:MAG: DNA-binding response regulator [Bacteroidetes bacterium GWE2_29_8]|nr:MAG: DNA-binding response regulator [Bacteroidetes bacterium GWE2_29_8]OFY25228.1 MAG: DNA-binding response regulator [Bacteroidetes bacterium GWF2_29_10]
MSNSSILVIDDEVQIRKLLEITLSSNNFNVTEAIDGKSGLLTAANHPPDLIILDLGLPDIDGQNVLKNLREWYLNPIIVLSVRNSELDIITALDNGANDYLVKPFRTGELLARIRTALRLSQSFTTSAVFEFENIKIDFANHLVKKNDEIVKLTTTEFSLLGLLVKNEGRVLTHSFILKEIWGVSYVEQTQYLRVFIAQLRKKIEDNPNQPKFIKTESRIGYRFIS